MRVMSFPAVVAVALAVSISRPVLAQVPASTTLDEAVPPGNNYDKAEFRLWYPADAGTLRGVLVLVPGSNGDGRAAVDDSVWRAFATRHGLALVGCRFTDKPHDQGFIEEYVDVARGSGAALVEVLRTFAARAKHPELADARRCCCGACRRAASSTTSSSRGSRNACHRVRRQQGRHLLHRARATRGARNVPGMLFVGGKDLEFRTNTIVGLFAVNRRAGALWALAEEPGAAHIVGRSRDMAVIFFDDVLALRQGAGETSLKAVRPKSPASSATSS